METQLQYIATIQTGVFAKPVLHGEVVYFQAKHFDENGQLLDLIIPDLSYNNQINKHILIDGDILFAAKGSKNFATQILIKNGKCVASSTFLVIRLKDEFKNSQILPEFLCWYINQPKTQEQLKAKARGSSIQSISKMDLLELEIHIPSVEKQRIIVKVVTLQKTEQSIIKKLQQLKEQYILQRLFSAITI